MTFSREIEFCILLSRTAGEIMRQAFGTKAVTWKGDSSPLTEADFKINQLVIDNVREQFAGYGVWGEEKSFNASAARRFLVDPIDGTMPFVIGAPLSSFVMAYVQDDKVLGGIVYDPFMDRLYVAELGKGAFCNNEQLQVSDKTNPANMFFYVGSRVSTAKRSLGTVIDALVERGVRTHSFNSSAYGLTRIAAGSSDGLMTTADACGIAAADLILREAGGVSSTFAGEPWDISLNKKLGYVGASSRQTLDIMLKAINGDANTRH